MSVTISYRSIATFVAGVTATVVALFVFQALSAEAAPGDTDATFVAITPCRLIDTRPGGDRVGTHGAFGVGDTKTVAARGTNGKCSIPSDAVGLSLNVTAVGATAPSFLTVWPDGDLPKASSLNPGPGQPPTPNAVTTTLSGAGSFNVFNKAGSVDVIVDVNGYYTKASLLEFASRLAALEAGSGTDTTVLARISALEAENAALKELTAPMSLETVDDHPVLRFSGVNVQIVNGSGVTRCYSGGTACNGLGNLIVGYNKDPLDEYARTGSHNIVAGANHEWTSHSGIVVGYSNTISGEYASVTAGSFNTASRTNSSVSGGWQNTASGFVSSVAGGSENTAIGDYSSVSGGDSNTASGAYSSVSGGKDNTAGGEDASVSGGNSNTASGYSASVSGGLSRSVTTSYDWRAGTLFETQ